jgi:2-dehydropantoate 2-reductase
MMRFIIYGAGAVGGSIGARLFEYGHDVVLVARGDHYEAIAADGLTLESPTGRITLPIPVVDHPRHLDFGDDDVVMVAVKSQQTAAVLDALAPVMPPSTPLVCAQNGTANELAALRLFPNVYAVPVVCPCVHLEPGVVKLYSSPISGVLDIGRFPSGVDEVAESVASALSASTFSSYARPDIMPWKWAKLLLNLGNAVEALFGPSYRGGPIGEWARAEGKACLHAAGIAYVPDDEERARRNSHLRPTLLDGQERPGGSTWQSLARATGDIEVDYLNGEVALLGRLHGVPTPVNDLLQRQADEMARRGTPPGSISEEEFLALLDPEVVIAEAG